MVKAPITQARRASGKRPMSSSTAALSPLIGRWKVTIRWSPATHKIAGGPRVVTAEARGSWLKDGAALDFQLGSAHWLLGGDDDSGEYVALYSDARPVSRLCQMSLTSTHWKMWRDEPKFRQRFEARIQKGGRKMVAHWDKAERGQGWARDFDLTFVRMRRAST